MNENLKETVRNKKIQAGLKYLDSFPEEIIDRAVECYKEMLIHEMLKSYPETMLERVLENSPELMVDRLLEKYPHSVAGQWLKILPEMARNKEVKDQIYHSLREYLSVNADLQSDIINILFDLNKDECLRHAMEFEYDSVVDKIIGAGKDNKKIFVNLIRAISNASDDSMLKLLEKIPKMTNQIYQEVGGTKKILLGGAGKAEYNPESGQLILQGYYISLQPCDKIEIFYKNEKMGIAEAGKKRPDVYEKYPNYHNIYSGWEFSAHIDGICQDDKVEIRVNRKGEIIKKETKKINVSIETVLELKKSYYIDLNCYLDLNNNVYNRISRFNGLCAQLEQWFDWNKDEYYQKFLNVKPEIVEGDGKVEEILLGIFCDKDRKRIHLSNAEMEYQDIGRLWTIINELLIEEEYFFETDKPDPFIIDGGANIGLAIYYFKSRFPNCRIIAFEPSEEAFSVLKRNIELNGWDKNKVEALCYALDSEEKEQTLYIPVNDCLGASLTRRPYEYNDREEVRTEIINTKVLNDFISSEVDFLKLDVEGMETRIIKKLDNKLSLIQNIFLEYHYGNMVEDNDILELLGLLEKHGMDYQLTKSPGFTVNTAYRAMKFVGQKYSLNIWAKRKAKD